MERRAGEQQRRQDHREHDVDDAAAAAAGATATAVRPGERVSGPGDGTSGTTADSLGPAVGGDAPGRAPVARAWSARAGRRGPPH
ncbi:hypothetical protein PAI11_44010 [Patulibacter medicamentivorans]|uniref:Uncharacterized protein n=1 Tax=Patulibacter medicamentivorans TaxID=1097667 RepID=H0EC16_9ACTN|nr:hypothetical protein PAI11_44010 [Patulibacter medicamentivorans]